MFNQLSSFVQIKIQKNGKVKFTNNIEYYANVCKLLKTLGFGQTVLNKKKIYYQRTNEGLKLVKFFELRVAFKEFLKTTEFIDQNEIVSLTHILDWFYSKTSIKPNKILLHYLEDSLTEIEEHELKMELDYDYRSAFEASAILDAFETWGLKKSYDKIQHFSNSQECDLFYKRIEEAKYLLFNQIKYKKAPFSIFECWITKFKSESLIGDKAPLEQTSVILNFNLDRDFELIESYVR